MREAVHQHGVARGEGLGIVAAGERLHLLDVVAGAEGPPAPADEQHAHVVHPGDSLQRRLERRREIAVQRVESLGAVEREAEDAVGRCLQENEVMCSGDRLHG